MVKEKRFYQMGLILKEYILMGKNVEKVNIFGLQECPISANGLIMR